MTTALCLEKEVPQQELAPPDAMVQLPGFDLGFVERQMLSQYSDWSRDRVVAAIEEYRKFLVLCRFCPNTSVGISRDADKVWHCHILNTRRYEADCLGYFGFYLHHTPDSGEEENRIAQDNTNKLFLEMFGQSREVHPQATCVAGGCMNNG